MAAIKTTYDSIDDVPEALRPYYVEADGRFTLEGVASKEKLDEFRNNNRALMKQVAEMKATYDGVDPERFRELTEAAQKARDKKLIDAGKVDEMLAERVNAMKAEHEKTLKALETEKTSMRSQLEGLLIDNAIRESAAKSGVRASAIDDVLLRGKSVFKLVDGKPVPLAADGQPIYGKSGDVMGVAEYVSSLSDVAPHLFEPSNGSGAKGSTPSMQTIAGRVARGDQKGFLENLDAFASNKASFV